MKTDYDAMASTYAQHAADSPYNAHYDRPSVLDLIVCALVIHHLEDRAACLREFSRVLRPGGHAVLSTQHPTTDWLRKGGSYFETKEEEDTWHRDGGAWTVRFWREPLTSFCAAISSAGFLIERLVEPVPTATMRERWPEEWEKLRREPGFLALRLLKPR